MREEERKKERRSADRNKSTSTIARTGPFCYSRAWKPLTPTISCGCQRNTSSGSVVDPLASLPMKLGWNNISTQRKHSAPIEIDVRDIPSYLLLCRKSERVPSLSEVLQVLLCKITATHAKGGGMQSVSSKMGTPCDTPSPESIAMSVASPETYKTVWVAKYVSNMVCVMRPR